MYICTGENWCLSILGDTDDNNKKKKSFWGAVIQILILSSLSLLLWAFPLFSLFLLHAARGLCSQPRELTVVIMVLTMKDLKLLLGFFSFNESEKSGVEGDKRKEGKRWRHRKRFHVHKENLSKKNKTLKKWISYEKEKKYITFSIHHMEVSRTVKIYEAR